MNFDERIKARAKREDCPIPEGFDQRMDELLDALPARPQPEKPRRPVRRAVVLAAVAAALMVGAGAAAPVVLSMAQGTVNFFSGGRGEEHVSQRGAFEKYNAAAGVSQTVDGRTLTIDNIAVDNSYMNVFYTLTGEQPLEKFQGVGDELYPESAVARYSAPCFWANVDGKELDTTGSVESEAYFVDDYTLRGMQRIVLKQALPDEFNLTLFTGGTSKEGDAEFTFALAVDKSAVAVDSLTVEPKLDFSVNYSNIDELGEPYHVQHDLRIERVSISPFGSTITLSEVTPYDSGAWDSFILRDEKGNDLFRLPSGGVGSSDILRNRVSNPYEFIGADTSARAITLIPFTSSYRSHQVTGPIDAMPLTDNTENGVTLESLTVGAEEAAAVFSMHGAVWNTSPQFDLLDENGEHVAELGDGFMDQSIDRETGLITVTLRYPGASAEAVQRVKNVYFWQQDDITLLEDQSVTIELQ